MSDSRIPVSPATSREPAHPSITPDQIAALVDKFYGRARLDPRLGPIFEAQVNGNWGPHLAKMKGFWRSVLLRTGEYDGRPVPAHAKIREIEQNDFVIWLDYFRETVDEVFEPDARPIVIEAAERIASSLWLATSGNVLAKPPNWSKLA